MPSVCNEILNEIPYMCNILTCFNFQKLSLLKFTLRLKSIKIIQKPKIIYKPNHTTFKIQKMYFFFNKLRLMEKTFLFYI